MDLVERRQQLDYLAAALDDAGQGRGRLVLVTGEAGAGKTALVRSFTDGGQAGRVLWGICDDLLVPRPLGPFRDIAAAVGGALEAAIRSGPAIDVPDALLEELATPPRPVVLVVEDVHWADEATLDMVRFLGRRIERMSALMILTYRRDEVPPDHPLPATLSAIPSSVIRRVALPALSAAGVAFLAGSDDVDELHRVTGGNPFFVTEMVSHPSPAGVPRTVQDAVMARVLRLGEAAGMCVETASVVPSRIEHWLLVETGVASGIDEAVRTGVLEPSDDDRLEFCHELVRQAVEKSLGPSRRRQINQRVLDSLVGHGADPARLTHHAVEAGDSEAVARFAPEAAEAAASLDSHREALAHLRRAVEHRQALQAHDLADIYYRFAHQAYLTERHDEALEALRAATRMHEELGDREALGRDLFLLSELSWYLCSGAEAREASKQALNVLEPLPAAASLAWVYAQQAKLALTDNRHADAVEWGEKAIELGRAFKEREVLVHALTSVGSAKWLLPPHDNRALFEALELARANRLHDWVGRTYANITEGYLHDIDHTRVRRFVEEGLAFCEANDLVVSHNKLLAHRSLWHLEQGRWSEAETDVRRCLDAGDVTRIQALAVLGWLESRRGQPDGEVVTEQAVELAGRLGDTHYHLLGSLPRVEWLWLNGKLGRGDRTVSSIWDEVTRGGVGPWMMGEAALWAGRAGLLEEPPPDLFEPYVLHLTGRWEEAAEVWEDLGRPYAMADALADSPRSESLLKALEVLNDLAANPRAAMVRRRLSGMGVTRIPRGPRPATRANPAGLTLRQTEVLRLMEAGLTYKEIAERLYISRKTVDHHVSAVRLKLGVSSRQAAVEAARKLGILGDDTP